MYYCFILWDSAFIISLQSSLYVLQSQGPKMLNVLIRQRVLLVKAELIAANVAIYTCNSTLAGLGNKRQKLPEHLYLCK